MGGVGWVWVGVVGVILSGGIHGGCVGVEMG